MRTLFPVRISPRAAVLGTIVLLAAVSTGVAIAASESSGGERELAAAPTNTSPPTVHGVLTAGATLTAKPGTWHVDAPPASFAYRWFRCEPGGACEAIGGASQQTYVLGTTDVGKRMLVQVTAIDSAGAISAAVNSRRTRNAIRPAEEPAVPPVNVAIPAIGGGTLLGSRLRAFVGQWNGFPVPVFTLLWQRCGPAGDNCNPIPGATASTYVLTAEDVAATMRLQVTATNAAGTGSVVSPVTRIVRVPLIPANTQPPTISGIAATGQTLTGTHGQWSGAEPLAFTQQWRRCNAEGGDCEPIEGATQQSYLPQAADIGRRLVVVVTATNGQGAASATSASTPVVTSGAPPGGTIPVAEVVLPNRLVVSGVDFEPDRIRSREPFTARFRVTDSEGRWVSGAEVFLSAIPFGRIVRAPIRTTGLDGWATFTLQPTARLPLQRGFLITIFVRVTKPGEPVLAGVSDRRLVSVRIASL